MKTQKANAAECVRQILPEIWQDCHSWVEPPEDIAETHDEEIICWRTPRAARHSWWFSLSSEELTARILGGRHQTVRVHVRQAAR